jgi:hypothetical protein
MSEEVMSVDIGGGRERKVRVDYPSNAKSAKNATSADKVPVEKVVTGDVTLRKKGIFGKIHDVFLAEESNSVMNYVVMDVLVPAAKNMISDAVSQGVERLMFGDARPRGASGTRPGYTNYNSYNKPVKPQEYQPRSMNRQARAQHDFSDIILQTRGEAEGVIDHLLELVSMYQMATVADLYQLIGVSGEFTDDKWGWYDLRSAGVRQVRGGYLLILPRTQPIT